MSKSVITAERLYEQSIDEVVQSLLANRDGTTLVMGHMGTGKSSILKILAEKLPTHVPCYFDGTTKDLGDLYIPKVLDMGGDSQFVRFVPNEEFGIHYGKPVILMFDEYGKMNPSVKNACMETMLSHKVGGKKLL